MAINILTQSQTLLKTGISVAPVVDWHLYDSAYTERFMSTPQENPEGYNKTSLLNRFSGIKTRFLMVHGASMLLSALDMSFSNLIVFLGLGDDNVHFANSAELALKMINNGMPFDTFYYPNNDHSINSNGSFLTCSLSTISSNS
jgi:dipeptidyl-peptidase 4